MNANRRPEDTCPKCGRTYYLEPVDDPGVCCICNASVLYFAYGMNMSPSAMPQAPDAELLGPGVLRDWRLRFSNYADVQREDGAEVYGSLWRISPATLRSLDGREGYPHFYDRCEVEVKPLDHADAQRAIVYFMREPMELCEPADGYLSMLIEGYYAAGLPSRAWQALANAAGKDASVNGLALKELAHAILAYPKHRGRR